MARAEFVMDCDPLTRSVPRSSQGNGQSNRMHENETSVANRLDSSRVSFQTAHNSAVGLSLCDIIVLEYGQDTQYATLVNYFNIF